MGKFERTDVSLIQKEINKSVEHPKIGKVIEVYEHGAEDDDSNFEADVLIDGKRERKCPILNSGSGTIDIPRSGDKVLLVFTEQQNKKPHIIDTVWTATNRPPLGKSGMVRRRLPIGDAKSKSVSGDGNLYFTGYTEFDNAAANTGRDFRDPEKSLIQIAKHKDTDNHVPTDQSEVPVKMELYDAPIDGEGHVHIDANVIDNNSDLGLDIKLDLKTGELTIRGENGGDQYEIELDVKNETMRLVGDSDAGNTMGSSFDFNSNTFKIADGNQYGIESDGNGNFKWSHNTIDFQDDNGSINL